LIWPQAINKRSKKLLLIASGVQFKWANLVQRVTDKSFLVLFFKKELLSFPSFPTGWPVGGLALSSPPLLRFIGGIIGEPI
jgi:hypothetical protein